MAAMRGLADLLRVPYAAGGRGPAGADCYGLAMLAGWELFGVDLPADPATDLAERQGWRPVVFGAEMGGDVAEMRTVDETGTGERLHCALVLERGRILNTSAALGAHIVRYSARHRHGIVRFWRSPQALGTP